MQNFGGERGQEVYTCQMKEREEITFYEDVEIEGVM
jgi:hypothetical protein